MDTTTDNLVSPQRANPLRGAWRACRDVMSHAARSALDIALPTFCVACREPVAGVGVCADCWTQLSFIERPFCPRLGMPFVYDPGSEMLSMEAIANPSAYQRARAVVRYNDVAKVLVHALKYQDRTDLAPAMGRWMARAGSELLGGADVLIPVPLHWRRGWSRRYNGARWRASSPDNPEFQSRRTRCGAPVRPGNRSDCREMTAHAMCRALSRLRWNAPARSRAAASS